MSRRNFFLGAGCPTGFAGYFSQLSCASSPVATTLIKAGPGCGKSTFMKRIGDFLEKEKKDVELIHCSSDPNSLDGVVCTDIGFAIIDATAPHTIDPCYPGAVESVLSLYHLLDEERLYKNKKEIIELFDKNSCFHERSTRYLNSAGSLMQDSMRVLGFCIDAVKLDKFCKRFATRKLKPKKDKKGSEQLRVLSAITPYGIVFYGDTVKEMAQNIVVLEDDIGFVSKQILAHLRTDALEKGYDVYSCYCPMFPYDKLDHLIIPELSLAIVTKNRHLEYDYGETEVIRSNRFIHPERYKERKKRLKFNRFIIDELLAQSMVMLKNAKDIHDQIETYYIEAMDFERLDEMLYKLKERLR